MGNSLPWNFEHFQVSQHLQCDWPLLNSLVDNSWLSVPVKD